MYKVKQKTFYIHERTIIMNKSNKANSTYERALEHVKEVKDFYTHLIIYGIMGCFFLTLNILTSFGNWWFFWPMLGWGIGIAIHFVNVFFLDTAMSKEWEEDQIKNYMGEDEYKKYISSVDDL